MKKIILISLICSSLLLSGCRSKNKAEKKQTKPEKTINLNLGEESLTFKEEVQTCGTHQIQSNVVFSNEQDDNGNLTGSYEIYDCQDDNVNLKTAKGTYSVDDLDVIFTDSYGEELSFKIKDDNTIVLKDSSNGNKTFTK